MSKRGRPNVDNMRGRTQHSYDHRGQTGKYGKMYKEDLPMWSADANEHEVCIIPFSIGSGKNSEFRNNPDLNMPFSKDELKEGAFDYKLTVLIHHGIGPNEDAVLCLRTIGKSCPICEERDRLTKEDPDAYKEEISGLNPWKRALYNIICFDSDKEFDKGVQVWEAPHASIEDVLSELSKKPNRRTGEIEHKDYQIPEERWNVFFERVGKGISTEYKQLEILERKKSDEFTDKEIDQLYKDAYDFEDLIEIKSYDELYEMQHGIKPDGEAKEEPVERGRGGRSGGRGRDTDEGGKEETTVRGRGRGDRSRGSEEEKTSTRGGRRPSSGQDKDSGKPECFGAECNQKDECEKCSSEMFDACYKKSKE